MTVECLARSNNVEFCPCNYSPADRRTDQAGGYAHRGDSLGRADRFLTQLDRQIHNGSVVMLQFALGERRMALLPPAVIMI